MRLRLLPFLLLLATSASAATIRQAHTTHMREGQFQRLREFFTGEEATGNRLILRTHPEERTGQYFVLILDERLEALPASAEFVVDVISTEGIEPETFTFSPDPSRKPRTRQILLGLTGEDWPSGDRKALAWRVQLMADGEVASEWKSFLWEMP